MRLSRKKKAELMGGSYTKVLMEHESALAVLYKTFASAFKGHRKFWEQLAAEESGHKNIISMLDKKIKDGEWGFKRPSYLFSNVTDSTKFVQNVVSRIQREGMTMKDAVAVAIRAERSMLESHYMDIVEDDQPEVKRVLRQLEQDSKGHLARVEKKARIFKWGVLGRRVCKPSERIEIEKTAASDKVKLAQSELLDCLIVLEESLNALYKTYHRVMKNEADFWSKYAAEELQHAAMLKGLKRYIADGALFTHLDSFDKEQIVQQIESIMDSEYDAHKDDMTMGKALGVALKHESTLVESAFYRDVESSAPEFRHVATRMQEHLKDHVKRLQDKIVAIAKGCKS